MPKYYELQTPRGAAIYKDNTFIPFNGLITELSKLSSNTENLEVENSKLKSMIFDYIKELQKTERDQEALRNALRKLTELYQSETQIIKSDN